MSSQNLDGFYNKVMSDPSLQGQLKDIKDEHTFIERAVELGKRHGFEFTAEEARAKLASARPDDTELSEQQLESVAGGAVSLGGSILCGYCGSQSGTSIRQTSGATSLQS